jgi:hypothetical protein
MKIVELILDEEQEGGIEAISIVESPAIESDFVALESQEVKLAEVDKEKKILLGALLIPNKPIYRNGEEGDYYIFFSKETIVKASQMYLKNGYQNKSTLEHAKALNGLTLVESWIVESETQDKSRKYGLDVPVGTWMGAVKVDNDKVWDEYVKTNKVKGFSIEGYFADKMEKPKKEIKEDMSEKTAAALLSAIENIVKGKKVELALIDDVNNLYEKAFTLGDVQSELLKAQDKVKKSKGFYEEMQKAAAEALVKAKDLGASDFIKLFTTKEEEAKGAIKGADAKIKAINSAISIN